MKIGIVTWFHYKNYGTILQAYALQNFLKIKGYNCVLINYIPIYNKNFLEKVKSGKFKKRIGSKIETYCFKFLGSDIKEKLRKRNIAFETFIKKNIELTLKIQSNDDLLKLNDMFDYFICGSDQIWNPENLNGVYYLSFVNEENKKISYAPSFGVRHIPASKKEKIQHWVNKFDKLSVREEDGASILKTLTQKDIEVVVDPTLLLSKTNWEQILVNPNIHKDYILCYFLGDRKEYWEVVQKLQKITGYRVVIIPIKFNSYLQKYDIRTSTGPEEFIGLIKNAKLILTDSFHGTIFSLKFEKDFYVFKRFKDKNKGSQNSRIYNILKMLNLEDRLIDNNFFISYKNDIYIDNYEQINKVLNEKIEDSTSYLMKTLNEFDKDK
ncbi:MAG: polysaccharide pyruvyl transferase family protein [Epulopiscium sp.]|nr:polysaccharide pyruvyl transferase family protein [Candidatus Epulonipiscium sp.]